MDNFKSTELEEALSSPIEKTEKERQLEHNTFRKMLATGFQRDEEDITINFGRRTVLGFLEDGSYRDEITSAKIDAVMNVLAEDTQPEFLTYNSPFIEIKAQDEVLLRAEQTGEVTVNQFDLLRLFNREQQTTRDQIEADSKFDIEKPSDEIQQQFDQLDGEVEEELGELWEFYSSVLKFGLYEADTQELTLEFQSGKDYTYRDISLDVWENFKESGSAGQFYNQEIKGQYSVEKVGENLLNNRQTELDKVPVIDESVTLEIPFLSPEAELNVSHPLQDFDTSSIKDFLNQEYQLTDQLTEIHRVDAGDKIDYEALKGVVEKAVENLYPEWDEADPTLADEIQWYRMNDRSRELQVSTDLVLEEIDSEARETARALNTDQLSWEAVNPPTPIRFQTTDTGAGDSHFLDAVHQYVKEVHEGTDPRLLMENTGLSPAQVLVDEIILQDPNISGYSETQDWVYSTAQDIHQDVSQIRQDFVEQQQVLVEEIAPQLVDILNELGMDNYQGKHRTIEFDKEQNQLTLIANATGAVVMTAQWYPDEEKWQNKGSSLTPDDRDQIREVAQRIHQKQKETGLER